MINYSISLRANPSDQDRLDVGTVVFGAVSRDMLGKLVQCHDF